MTFRSSGNNAGLGRILVSKDGNNYWLDPATGTVASASSSALKDVGITDDFIDNLGGEGSGGLADMLGNKDLMGGITGLASTAMQAIALPTQLKQAKLQNKSLQFNLDTAKQEQARRNKNISSFNNFSGG